MEKEIQSLDGEIWRIKQMLGVDQRSGFLDRFSGLFVKDRKKWLTKLRANIEMRKNLIIKKKLFEKRLRELKPEL